MTLLAFQPTAGANPGRCWLPGAPAPGWPGFNPRPGRTPAAAWAWPRSPVRPGTFQPTAGANPGRCLWRGDSQWFALAAVSTHGRGEPRPLLNRGNEVVSYRQVFQPTAGANPGRCVPRQGSAARPTSFNPRPGRTPAAATGWLPGGTALRCFNPRPGRTPAAAGNGAALVRYARFQPTAGANPGRCTSPVPGGGG